MKRLLTILSLLAALMPATAWAAGGEVSTDTGSAILFATKHIGVIPIWIVLPFIGMLLSIAVAPVVNGHWWEHHFPHMSLLWGVLGLMGLFIWGEFEGVLYSLSHVGLEYMSFIALVGSLFVIGMGIYIRGDLRATPMVLTTILAVGAVLANFIATTGAAMVLLPLLLNTIKERKKVVHVVIFFIFIVANCGGLLLPIGDPPLFLGFLRGVPFEWTLTLFWNWLLVNGLLLMMFFAADTLAYAGEQKADLQRDDTEVVGLSISGKRNILLVIGVIGAVLFLPVGWREAAQVALAGISLWITPISGEERQRNQFSWEPIKEVGILFAAIFITMIPALEILNAYGNKMGLNSELVFYVITGGLSAFLDNAPTYLVFFEAARGIGAPEGVEMVAGVRETYLQAISMGAVFFGAMSYIGNAPNFMVRAIAEKRGVNMPSFFGYMVWSIPILGIVLAINAWFMAWF